MAAAGLTTTKHDPERFDSDADWADGDGPEIDDDAADDDRAERNADRSERNAERNAERAERAAERSERGPAALGDGTRDLMHAFSSRTSGNLTLSIQESGNGIGDGNEPGSSRTRGGRSSRGRYSRQEAVKRATASRAFGTIERIVAELGLDGMGWGAGADGLPGGWDPAHDAPGEACELMFSGFHVMRVCVFQKFGARCLWCICGTSST